MPSKMQTAYETEVGQSLLGQVRSIGGDVDQNVQGQTQIAKNYEAFRASLGGDPDEEAVADQWFDEAVVAAKAHIDALTAGQKVYFDRFLDGLGYVPKV